MMIVSPLISLWIGYVMPAGLCVYWVINNLLSIVQELVSGKLLKKDYEKAAAARAEQERLEKEEEKRKKKEAAERRALAAEEAKKNKGKKKPAENTEKKKDRTTDAGRIGMRPYARGRSYDEDRYGGVTPYQDPGAPIDEQAVEQALAAKGKLPEEPQEETADLETAQVEELQGETPSEGEQTPDAPQPAAGEGEESGEEEEEADEAEDEAEETEE
jgi:YidC/Oxa1 family membrane protein insertase